MLIASKYAIMRFRGRKVHAEYIDAILPEYIGNPFNEALPPMLENVSQIIDKLTELPEGSWHESSEVRLKMLGRLDRIRVPNNHHIELYRSFDRMLRDGYVGRNPSDPRYISHLKTTLDGAEKEILKITTSNFQINPELMKSFIPYTEFDENDERFFENPLIVNTVRKLIYGMSGVGKTHGMYLVLRLYPQIILHTRYHGRRLTALQLSWLKLECPPDGSLKSLCCGFLLAVDSLLGTNFFSYYGQNGRANKTQLAMGVAIVASVTGLGVLVIDHLETLAVIKKGQKKDIHKNKTAIDRATDELMAFLLLLDNLLGIPIIFMGTPAARDMIVNSKNFSLVSRVTQEGELEWKRMLPSEKDPQSWRDWNTLLSTLWTYQYTDVDVPLDDQFRHTIYDLSQGITRIAVALFKRSQHRAITTNSSLSPALIKSVFYDEFAALAEPLEGIKKGDKRILLQWEDIYNKVFNPSDSGLIFNLRNFEAPYKGDTPEFTPKGFFMPNPLVPQSTTSSPSLMNAIKDSKEPNEIYQSLKAQGFIRPMSDLLGEPQ